MIVRTRKDLVQNILVTEVANNCCSACDPHK